MQITLVQAEIEQAIKKHVLGGFRLGHDTNVKITMRATRGTEGFQAVVDVTPADSTYHEAALESPKPIQQDLVEKLEAVAPTPIPVPRTPTEVRAELEKQYEEEKVAAPLPGEEPNNSDAVEEAPSPSPRRGSLFQGIKKPVNG